jgi:hypothetical protein
VPIGGPLVLEENAELSRKVAARLSERGVVVAERLLAGAAGAQDRAETPRRLLTAREAGAESSSA